MSVAKLFAGFANSKANNSNVIDFGDALVGELLSSDEIDRVGGGDDYSGTWSCSGSGQYYQSGGGVYSQAGGTFSQTGGSYSMTC